MVIVVLVTALLVIGIKESARVNNVIVFIKVSILVLLIALGLPLVSSANWGGPFIPQSDEWFHFGWSGICRAAGVVFFAYIGFDAVSTTAQEAKNPQRDMPIGIIGSLVICTILYCLGAYVLTGVVNYKQLHVPDPVAVATDAMGKPWLSFYVKIGAILGLSSVILVMLMSQPRIFYAMSKDGLLPPIVAKIHPKFHTPYLTTIITGMIVMMAAGLIPLSVAGELTSIGTLFAFAVVSAGVLYLRITQPDVERPFKAPLIWFTAPMGVLTAVALMATLPRDTWIRLVVWMVIGLVIYFVYGAHHSVLGSRKRVTDLDGLPRPLRWNRHSTARTCVVRSRTVHELAAPRAVRAKSAGSVPVKLSSLPVAGCTNCEHLRMQAPAGRSAPSLTLRRAESDGFSAFASASSVSRSRPE